MSTRSVSLSPDMADFVDRELAIGDYGSASDIVHDALRVLQHDRALERETLDMLRSEIARGLAEAERGEISRRSAADIAAAILGGAD